MRCGLEALPGGLAGTVVVTYGDVPLLDGDTLRALLAEHAAAGAAVTVLTAEFADPTGYGRVLRGPDGAVTGIVEHGDATPEQRAIREINSGIYAFDAAVLTAGLAELSDDNAQGELYLTDVVAGRRRPGSAGAQRGMPGPLAGRGRQRPGPARRRCGRAEPADPGALDARRRDRRGPRDHLDRRRRAAGPRRHPAARHPAARATVVADDAVVGPDTTLTDCEVGAGAHGGAHATAARR